MTFVNLSLLFGAAAITIPIVLHLIMRRKPKLLEFPALRFIQKRHDKNQRSLRLRHLLLLLLRALAIALLAFALARPSVKFAGPLSSLGSQEAPVAAALVFDVAPHMQCRYENKTRLDAAKEMGLGLLDELPRESKIAVLDTSPVQRGFDADLGVSKQRVSRLEAVNNSQPLAQAVDRAAAVLAEDKELPRKEIYVFTDLARAAWPDEAAKSVRDRINSLSGSAVYVIDVGVADPTNFSLGQIQLSRETLSKGGSVEVQAGVSCVGQGGERTIELCVLDANGKPQKRSEKTVTLKPGETGAVQFRLGDLESGTHQGFVRIVGQDALAADDTRHFTVEAAPAWPVLVVAPRPAQESAQHFVGAIAPTAFRLRGQARFDCQVIDFEELNHPAEKSAWQPLEKYAVVCLLDPPLLEPAVWKRLTDYVAEGHGLGVFLGRRADKESFNSAVAQQLLPGKLNVWARRPPGAAHLAPRDYQHPVLRAFQARAGNTPWGAFPVLVFWTFSDRPEGTATVVPYNDDEPALLERPVGAGRVLVMTTPVSDSGRDRNTWNMLPFDVGIKPWPFMILMNEMTSYLAGAGQQRLNYMAGTGVSLSLEEQDKKRLFVLTKPDGVASTLEPEDRELRIGKEEAEQVGSYRVQASGTPRWDRGFSVNLTPSATRLDRIDESQMLEFFAPLKPNLVQKLEQIDRASATGRVGRDLYPAAILILALVLAAEYVVANKFYKEA